MTRRRRTARREGKEKPREGRWLGGEPRNAIEMVVVGGNRRQVPGVGVGESHGHDFARPYLPILCNDVVLGASVDLPSCFTAVRQRIHVSSLPLSTGLMVTGHLFSGTVSWFEW